MGSGSGAAAESGLAASWRSCSEGAVAAAAGGIDAALDGGEGLHVLGDDFALAVGFGDGAEALVILVIPEGGFGGVEAAEGPFGADEVVDEAAGVGGGGLVGGVVFVDELLEVGGVLAGDDERIWRGCRF